MKRICYLASVIAVACLLFGCGADSRELLGYQNGLSEVEAEAQINGTAYRIRLSYGDDGAQLEITEPENVGGVLFVRDGTGTFAALEEMKIPVSPELFSGIAPIVDAFGLSPERITSISKDENGNTVYSVSGEGGVYTVAVNKEGEPVSIYYEGERNFSLSNILLQKIT